MARYRCPAPTKGEREFGARCCPKCGRLNTLFDLQCYGCKAQLTPCKTVGRPPHRWCPRIWGGRLRRNPREA